MLVRNYCNKVAKEFARVKSGLVCPVKEEPHLCPFGDMCWVHPVEATEEVKQRIYNNYKQFQDDFEKRHPTYQK